MLYRCDIVVYSPWLLIGFSIVYPFILPCCQEGCRSRLYPQVGVSEQGSGCLEMLRAEEAEPTEFGVAAET